MSSSETILSFINNELDGDAFKAELAKVLPKEVSTGRFVTVLKNFLKSNPRSREMLGALAEDRLSRASFLQEALRAASDGLVVDSKECSINLTKRNAGTREAPQWVQVFQYMPMVQGIIKTIYNTGLASNVSTGVIHANDKYEFDLGSAPYVKHQPALSGRGERVAAFASVSLKGHEHPVVEIMTAEDIASVQSRSKSKEGPWKTDTSEMWRKSALRRLSKRLPRSSEKAAMLENVLSAVDDDFDLDQTPQVADDLDQRPAEEKVQDSSMPKGLQKVTNINEYTTEEVF